MDISLGTPRALLALTLARAVLPPPADASPAIFGLLVSDLAELSVELGLDPAAPLDALRASCTSFVEDSPLVHYSRLFLSPSHPAHLNLGWYLDGSLYGTAQDSLRQWHAALGVDKSEDFKDLPDHLASLLELLGLLEGRGQADDAARFAQTFLHPALPRLEHGLAQVDGTSPYRALIGWMQAALNELYPPSADATSPGRKPFGSRPQRPDWKHCTQCGAPVATARDVAVMEKALAESGLPANHLALCPECRGNTRGWDHRPLPTIR